MMAWRRTKVPGERNLYLAGEDYWTCATPEGSRQAQWKRIGNVGIMHARRERDAWVAGVRAGKAVVTRRAVKVRDLIDDYLERCEQRVNAGKLGPRTLDAYRLALTTHFEPAYGSRSIASLRPEDLVAWQAAQRAAGAADWSIRNRWTAIRGMLTYAARTDRLDRNPADLLMSDERPSAGESRVRFLNRREMHALLTHTPERFRAAVATLLFTGLRASELLGLVWEEVDFDGHEIKVRYQMPRGGSTAEDRVKLKRSSAARREIIMAASLAKVLRAHKLSSPWSHDRHLVFTSTVGTTMTYRRLGEAVSRAAQAASLHGVSAHILRHTFASVLIYQHNDATFVARQLGHANTSTTWDVYGHLFEAAKQAARARDQLDAEFGSLLG